MKQSNYHFSYKVIINSTKSKVWETLIDVKTWHIWDTELIEAQLDEDFELGAKGTMKPKVGPILKFHISDFTKNEFYTLKVKMPVGNLVIKRSLVESNNSIQFTDDIEFTGFMRYIFGFILGRKFRKVLPDVLNNFKNLTESN